jgi:hypothetical protein
MLRDKFPGQNKKVTVARNKAHIEKFGSLKSSLDITTVIRRGMSLVGGDGKQRRIRYCILAGKTARKTTLRINEVGCTF